jgi:hypothetical protein
VYCRNAYLQESSQRPQFGTLLGQLKRDALSKTVQTAKLKSGLLISVIGTESDYLAQWNLSVRQKFTVLAMNQILPTNFLNEAGLKSTSRRRPTMTSLKRDQPRR